jgi:Immunoglobulin I-set domain
LNVKEGTSIELECQLSGLKDENYVKWLKDGTEVAYETVANSSQKLRFDVDSEDYKLTISDLSPTDDGTYDCAMLNERREFVIKSKRRYKLLVQGWCNSFNSRYHVLFSNRNQADAHVFCSLKILSRRLFNSIILISSTAEIEIMFVIFSTSQLHHKATVDEERGFGDVEQGALQSSWNHKDLLDERAG